MAIPDSFIDDLVNRTDITELVSGYVRLTKRSGGSNFGLCPFHSEKTPSFAVNSDKQIYHCFGCGKGGGVINFVMEIEGLPFHDAIEFLAKRAGMVVPDSDIPRELINRRSKMLELNRKAARLFYELLSAPEGKTAIEYLKRRGISEAMVKRFGLGVAPDSWNRVSGALLKKGYTVEDLVSAGLAKRSSKGDGIYDAFRNRLMFPVIDIRGGVIGFSGRILDDGEPKYLNTPETLVFNKSRNLFGLNLAKKTKKGMIILVEGNIDVVTCFQAGVNCAVASLGTSLTDEQARLISRYTDTVAIAYDSDEAGKRAAIRAISIIEKTGMSVKVVKLPDCKDPDEFVRKHGPDAFLNAVDQSENHIEYRLLTIKEKHNIRTDEGKLGYLSEAVELISRLKSAPEREVYGKRVGEEVGVSSSAVEYEVERALKKRGSKQRRQYETKSLRLDTVAQSADRTLRYRRDSSGLAEEGLIRSLIYDTGLIEKIEQSGFSSEELTVPFLKKIYESVKQRVSSGRELTVAVLLAELESGEASHLTEILNSPDSGSGRGDMVAQYIEKIRSERMKTDAVSDVQMLMAYKKYREKKDVGG